MVSNPRAPVLRSASRARTSQLPVPLHNVNKADKARRKAHVQSKKQSSSTSSSLPAHAMDIDKSNQSQPGRTNSAQDKPKDPPSKTLTSSRTVTTEKVNREGTVEPYQEVITQKAPPPEIFSEKETNITIGVETELTRPDGSLVIHPALKATRISVQKRHWILKSYARTGSLIIRLALKVTSPVLNYLLLLPQIHGTWLLQS